MGEQWLKKNIYDSKAEANPQAAGDIKFSQVKEIFKKIDPGPVNDASSAYIAASNALAAYTKTLEGYADKLIKHWQGENAQKALDQLGQVHRTAARMSDISLKTSNSFKWYGTEILPHYKSVGETMEDGWDDDDGDDNRWAKDKLEKLYMRTAESHNNVPPEVEEDLPDTKGGNEPPPGGGGMPPGGGGGSMPGGGPGGMPGGGSGLDGGKFPGGDGSPFANPDSGRNPHLSPSGMPDSSNLAGIGGDPGSGSGLGSFGSGGGSSLSSMGDPGGMPPGGGGGGGMPSGGGGNLPGGAGPGGMGTAGGGMGPGAMGGMGAGRGGAGAGRMGGMPMGGMPMGGGGAGNQGGQDRERETWLTEDEDVWGADDDTAPPVIG
ncbi:hypothetical protein [Actinomadura sp. 9N407]|uniref:hypothetical protein n=1 Tax=Actinomadura sp. 9N407 TaxID=3375154 RepID=UPI0037AC16D0